MRMPVAYAQNVGLAADDLNLAVAVVVGGNGFLCALALVDQLALPGLALVGRDVLDESRILVSRRFPAALVHLGGENADRAALVVPGV